jgi:hypothetical protein
MRLNRVALPPRSLHQDAHPNAQQRQNDQQRAKFVVEHALFRLSRLKAAIWENPSEKGSFFNVNSLRLYLETGGKKKAAWRDSSSFGRDDLLVLAKLAD